MLAIGNQLKGFFVVVIWLITMAVTTYIIMCSYRGHELYYAELKEFRGAFSRTLGGDWKERADFVQAEPTPDPAYPELSPKELISRLSEEQKEDLAMALVDDGHSVPRPEGRKKSG